MIKMIDIKIFSDQRGNKNMILKYLCIYHHTSVVAISDTKGLYLAADQSVKFNGIIMK